MQGYERFYQDVKRDVGSRIARFGAGEKELADFLKAEESQIRGAYKHLTEDPPLNDELTPEARWKATVSSVSMCLEYCY